jgi:hypothetical protein
MHSNKWIFEKLVSKSESYKTALHSCKGKYCQLEEYNPRKMT